MIKDDQNLELQLETIQMFSSSIKHFNNARNLLTASGKLVMVILEVGADADVKIGSEPPVAWCVTTGRADDQICTESPISKSITKPHPLVAGILEVFATPYRCRY